LADVFTGCLLGMVKKQGVPLSLVFTMLTLLVHSVQVNLVFFLLQSQMSIVGKLEDSQFQTLIRLVVLSHLEVCAKIEDNFILALQVSTAKSANILRSNIDGQLYQIITERSLSLHLGSNYELGEHDVLLFALGQFL
jgi:hypothetical protein